MPRRFVKPDAYSVRSATAPLPDNAAFLVLFREAGSGLLFYVAYTSDLSEIGGVGEDLSFASGGRSIRPQAGLLPGARILLDDGQIKTADYLSGLVQTYAPPEGWTAAAPQCVNGEYFWIEYEAGLTSDTIQARLRKSASPLWEAPETVRTMTVDGAPSTGGTWGFVVAAGPDFTSTRAGLWISRAVDANSVWWVHLSIALSGAFDQQAPAVENSDSRFPVVKHRAGFPLGSLSLIDSKSTGGDPMFQETYSSLVFSWPGDVSSGYTFWPPGVFVFIGDLAPDPGGVGVWMLNTGGPSGVRHFAADGSLLSEALKSWPSSVAGRTVSAILGLYVV